MQSSSCFSSQCSGFEHHKAWSKERKTDSDEREWVGQSKEWQEGVACIPSTQRQSCLSRAPSHMKQGWVPKDNTGTPPHDHSPQQYQYLSLQSAVTAKAYNSWARDIPFLKEGQYICYTLDLISVWLFHSQWSVHPSVSGAYLTSKHPPWTTKDYTTNSAF